MGVVEFVGSVNVVSSALFVCASVPFAAEFVVTLLVSVLLSAGVVVGAAVVAPSFGLGVVSAAMDLGVVVTASGLGVVLSGTFSLVTGSVVASEDEAFELPFDGVSVVIFATGVVSSSSVSFPFRNLKPLQQDWGLTGKQNWNYYFLLN